MKALSKPLSSPSRADKFPPPLMRFLRSNVGSRSRGRSRSSPLFYLRSKKSVPGVIETTQEPSSPKVTCIGQVRVRRSSKSRAKKPAGAAAKKRRRRRCCWWLFKKTLFCGKISPRFRSPKRPSLRLFCKWGSFFRCCYCKKVDSTEDSLDKRSEKNENGDNNNNRNSISNVSERDYCYQHERNLESSSSSPPKNALMLTRCRSAPYRSSSLAVRFWGSPLAETGDDNVVEAQKNQGETEDLQKPISETLVEESRMSRESNSKELEDNNCLKKLQDLKGGAVHPLLLTRCKSEPARTGERLIAQGNFFQRRLDS